MLEHLNTSERVVLVHMDRGLSPEETDLEELRLLAQSAGALPVGVVRAGPRLPDPRFFIGAGKVDEVRSLAKELGAELVLVNHDLSPSQERNLERALQCRVVDRTSLILDIFAQRARSFEGKLQVELAQLRHLASRLVRGWTHLERQKGGIGLRGPGETQLETDRRLINDRIALLKKRLRRVDARRAQSRRARNKNLVPTVSLVGYTNAGKSTLFNRLTNSTVYTADQLFATLDPTLRRIILPHGGVAVLADTVGFIRHLPHDLVAAFRATLQKVNASSLLLHLIDASAPDRAEHIQEVEQVLEAIGAAEVPRLEVYNKLDLLDGESPRIDLGEDGQVVRAWVSATTGAGMELLLEALTGRLHQELVQARIVLGVLDGRLRARLFQICQIIEDRATKDGGWKLVVKLPRQDYERLVHQEPELWRRLRP